jgi:hypothetical protein
MCEELKKKQKVSTWSSGEAAPSAVDLAQDHPQGVEDNCSVLQMSS